MVANRAMRKLLEEELAPHERKVELYADALQELLFPPFKSVGECIILSEQPAEILCKGLEQQLDIKNGYDHVWYEVSGTERRINDFLSAPVAPELGVRIAGIVAKTWATQLKMIDPHAKFCFVISCDEKIVTLRFHRVRPDEPSFLSDNLEDYGEEAVGYILA